MQIFCDFFSKKMQKKLYFLIFLDIYIYTRCKDEWDLLDYSCRTDNNNNKQNLLKLWQKLKLFR